MPTPDDIQADVRAFIAGNIRSVAQLELLLLLHDDPQKSWSAADAAQKLCTAVDMTGAQLGELRAQGLLTSSDGATPKYSYGPKSKTLAQAVDGLALLYQERRVSIITLIYAQPVDKLRSFADAFRILPERKDP